MSNLKDTDIDDLFRRASDKYPLRTDSADWDRMAAALENKGNVPPDSPIDTEEKRKKRRFFWLFLLLPLAGAGYYAWNHGSNAGTTSAPRTASAAVAPSTPGGSKTPGASTNPDVSETPGASAAPDASTTSDVSATPDASTHAGASQNATGSTSASASTHGATPAGATPAGAATAVNTPIGASTTTLAAARPAAAPNHAGSGKTHRSRNNNNTDNVAENQEYQPENSLSPAAVNPRQQPGGEIGSTAKSQKNEDRLFYDLQRAAIPHDYHVAVDVTAPAAKKETVQPKAKTKHFYAGLFGSPDLSTVKMQSVKGVGTTFGVILGYTFKGGRWAVETGAYVDRKKYYTEGEYFSTKEIYLPPNSWLTNVDGICYMWEIPLNARYNFNPGAKTSWFATAGLSTYLMTGEKYTYGLEWTGSSTPYDKKLDLNKASQYPFSIINLSVGFEQRLGKIGNLRIEPYARLPLTGLGTGKLSIMSAGVNIGITRQLW